VRPRSTPRRGASVVEALVGAALAGIALAGLAAVAGLATQSLRLARDTGIALALASERLEALRAGPRANGADSTRSADGTLFRRSWTIEGGRGRAVQLSVQVAWGGRLVRLASGVLP